MEALGTSDIDFLNGLLGQIGNAGSHGRELDPVGINFMLSVINGIQPRDQVEAMLASQMAAVHRASMTLARRLAHVEDIRQQDSAERAFTKLTRTFAAQMEALKRYRTGGEQKVTVQHVTVSDGGKAIVGNVTHGARREAANKSAPSRSLLADAKMAPVPILDESKRAPVPSLKEESRVTICATPGPCFRAGAAAREPALASPADRLPSVAKSAAACMVVRLDQVLLAATRTRSSMASSPARLLQNAGSSASCSGERVICS
jgi:hypothetical protein